jgi:hypothetical protein
MFLAAWRLEAKILRRDSLRAASLHGDEAREDSGTDVTEDGRSGNIRIVAVTPRDVAVRGLMASCDFFGERSMQYGTYASANS